MVKRDCGKSYAMKAIDKKKLSNEFGDGWKEALTAEKAFLTQLSHPLVMHVAYCFQNPQYLVIVMDLCTTTTLATFTHGSEHKLTPPQVRPKTPRARRCEQRVLTRGTHQA